MDVLLQPALASSFLKWNPLHTNAWRKKNIYILVSRDWFRSTDPYSISFLPDTRLPLWRGSLPALSSLSVTGMPPWSKKDSNTCAQAVSSHSFLVSALGTSLPPKWTAAWYRTLSSRQGSAVWRGASDCNPRWNTIAKKSLNHAIKSTHIKGTIHV